MKRHPTPNTSPHSHAMMLPPNNRVTAKRAIPVPIAAIRAFRSRRRNNNNPTPYSVVVKYPALEIKRPNPPRVKVTPEPLQSSAPRFTLPNVASAANAWPISCTYVTKSLIGNVMTPAKGMNQSARVNKEASTRRVNELRTSEWVFISSYTPPQYAWFGTWSGLKFEILFASEPRQ